MKKILTFLLALSTFQLFSQRTITGTVTDEKGETLVGAAVRILGTTVGTVTDLEGKYSLKVEEKSTFLSFSFAGMPTMNAEIGSANVINSVMKTTTLPEFVVAGYSRLHTIGCGGGWLIINLKPPRARYTTQTDQSVLTFNVLGNPFKDRFILSIKSDEDANAVVSLQNIEGKLVKSFQTPLLKGDNQIEMADLAHLVIGTYAISVSLLEQNDAPTITDKLVDVDLPYKFYDKIMSTHPELQKDRFKSAIPLSKEQYELVVKADKLRENVSKLAKTLLNIDPEFDYWDLGDDSVLGDSSILDTEDVLHITYKTQMQPLLNEYKAIMANPVFEGKIVEKALSLNDLVRKRYISLNNMLLVKREVILKKKSYTQFVVKM